MGLRCTGLTADCGRTCVFPKRRGRDNENRRMRPCAEWRSACRGGRGAQRASWFGHNAPCAKISIMALYSISGRAVSPRRKQGRCQTASLCRTGKSGSVPARLWVSLVSLPRRCGPDADGPVSGKSFLPLKRLRNIPVLLRRIYILSYIKAACRRDNSCLKKFLLPLLMKKTRPLPPLDLESIPKPTSNLWPVLP